MKLVIQIPCFNEAETLPFTVADLPREVPGFDRVEWLVVDDGSTDGTAAVAAATGVDQVVRHRRNRGLAAAFSTGLERALALGADVIVNTDADNQYDARDIERLVRPLLDGQADMVVGARPIAATEHFSPVKRWLQKAGSRVVRAVSGAPVPDAVSGFRAYTAEVAGALKVYNRFSYTVETLIQAGHMGWSVVAVPVRTNQPLRSSRLSRSTLRFVFRQAGTIVRIAVTYRPLRFFATLGAAAMVIGFALGLRFLYFYLTGDGSGHVQSVILSALLLGSGLGTVLFGMLADLVATNRKMGQTIDARLSRLERRLNGELEGRPGAPRSESAGAAS
jgi:glycosyltransferase involved in cell wall biosynthesis